MGEESPHTALSDHNIDYHIITLFERLEALHKESHFLYSGKIQAKHNMRAEVRTVDFWRSIVCEFMASFFYVFIVCGAAAGAGVGASVSSVLLATALASALAMAALTQCFLHISGAHINPAVTLASCVIRLISPLRAAMYVIAQCGGGIGGAALLYSTTVPGYQGNLPAAIAHSAILASWERLGVEFILTFVIVFSFLISTDFLKRFMGSSAISIGLSYGACSFVSMPYLNPARSFGPAFVLNKWDHQWVYWFGPIIGGICSGLLYQYTFRSEYRVKKGDLSSIHSDDDFKYNLDIENANVENKYANSLHRNFEQSPNKQNFYSHIHPHLSKLDHIEPLYDGARSMYSRTPTMPRSTLSRSQSVYTKSNAIINHNISQKSGPSIPVQSAFPIRIPHSQAQITNQLPHGNDAFYTIRNMKKNILQQQQIINHNAGEQVFQSVFSSRQMGTPNEVTFNFESRPEMVNGLTVQRNRGYSNQLYDSTNCSYQSSSITPPVRLNTSEALVTYTLPQPLSMDPAVSSSTSLTRIQPEQRANISGSSMPAPPPVAFACGENFTASTEASKGSPTQSSL